MHLKIFVAGDFTDESSETVAKVRAFAQALGREVILQGHDLLGACRNNFDAEVAAGAEEKSVELGHDPRDRITSWVLKGHQPAHRHGRVRDSELDDWELGNPRFRYPEPVWNADAVIVASGTGGTHRAGNWARIANKPLIAVPRFGGAAEQIYLAELGTVEENPRVHIRRSDYEDLSEIYASVEELAATAVSLAERSNVTDDVFVIMSFSPNPELQGAFRSFKDICAEKDYRCSTVKDGVDYTRVIPEIRSRITDCAFVIADFTEDKPNIFYEFGYAEATKRKDTLIATAKEGTQLPFDLHDVQVIYWTDLDDLERKLRPAVAEIARRQGRQ